MFWPKASPLDLLFVFVPGPSFSKRIFRQRRHYLKAFGPCIIGFETVKYFLFGSSLSLSVEIHALHCKLNLLHWNPLPQIVLLFVPDSCCCTPGTDVEPNIAVELLKLHVSHLRMVWPAPGSDSVCPCPSGVCEARSPGKWEDHTRHLVRAPSFPLWRGSVTHSGTAKQISRRGLNYDMFFKKIWFSPLSRDQIVGTWIE